MNIRRLVQNAIAGLAAVAVSFGGYVGVSAEANNSYNHDIPGVHELRDGDGSSNSGCGGKCKNVPGQVGHTWILQWNPGNLGGKASIDQYLRDWESVARRTIGNPAGPSLRGKIRNNCMNAMQRAAKKITDPAKRSIDNTWVVGIAVNWQVTGKKTIDGYDYPGQLTAMLNAMDSASNTTVPVVKGKLGDSRSFTKQAIADVKSRVRKGEAQIACVAMNLEIEPPPHHSYSYSWQSFYLD